MRPNWIKADSFDSENYWNFNGALGDHQDIGLSLYLFKDGTLKGDYFFDENEKPIKLEGKWSPIIKSNKDSSYHSSDFNFVSQELSDTGKAQATFEGQFNSNDDRDGLKGVRIDLKSGQKISFKLELESITPQDFGKRYEAADSKNDSEFDNFAKELKGEILTGKKEEVAQKIVYPLTVCIRDKEIEIKNKKIFVRKYDQIITPDFIKLINKAHPYHMFCRNEEVMFGETGAIWLAYNSGLKVVAINNCYPDAQLKILDHGK